MKTHLLKQQQSRDRSDYRDAVILEQDRPALEAAMAARAIAQAERDAADAKALAERQADEAARKAVSRHLGAEGERLSLAVTFISEKKLEGGDFGPRYLMRFRTDDGAVIIWWTGTMVSVPAMTENQWGKPEKTVRGVELGERVMMTATVKSHGAFDGEAQTTVLRAKFKELAVSSASHSSASRSGGYTAPSGMGGCLGIGGV